MCIMVKKSIFVFVIRKELLLINQLKTKLWKNI